MTCTCQYKTSFCLKTTLRTNFAATLRQVQFGQNEYYRCLRLRYVCDGGFGARKYTGAGEKFALKTAILIKSHQNWIVIINFSSKTSFCTLKPHNFIKTIGIPRMPSLFILWYSRRICSQVQRPSQPRRQNLILEVKLPVPNLVSETFQFRAVRKAFLLPNHPNVPSKWRQL